MPHHPYRHPIIQEAINMTWFQNKDGDGIVFYEYFKPIPVQAIALALTVVRVGSTLNHPRFRLLLSDRVLH
jgi:hypothetical protein